MAKTLYYEQTEHAAAVPMTDAEWTARVKLAAAYRIVDHLGWAELIFNHLTLRVPGPQPSFLINPFGLHYSEITASNLLLIDAGGNALRPGRHPVNRAGFVIHSAIHQHCEAAHCIMHIHTTAGMAVACKEAGLSYDNFYAAQLWGDVAYHDYEGVTTRTDEQDRLVQSLGERHCLILRNHGLLACGETLPLAFVRLWTLQRACEIQLAQAALGPAIPVPEAVAKKTTHDSFQFDAKFGAGQDVFGALVRQVERLDPSYKN